jgi:hypothetical protein
MIRQGGQARSVCPCVLEGDCNLALCLLLLWLQISTYLIQSGAETRQQHGQWLQQVLQVLGRTVAEKRQRIGRAVVGGLEALTPAVADLLGEQVSGSKGSEGLVQVVGAISFLAKEADL